MDNTRRTGNKAKQPRKLVIDIDLSTGLATMTTEGFCGPMECRDFSKPYQDLMGDQVGKDEDTPEASKKPSVERHNNG